MEDLIKTIITFINMVLNCKLCSTVYLISSKLLQFIISRGHSPVRISTLREQENYRISYFIFRRLFIIFKLSPKPHSSSKARIFVSDKKVVLLNRQSDKIILKSFF